MGRGGGEGRVPSFTGTYMSGGNFTRWPVKDMISVMARELDHEP
jgi:hypothetical protein